MENKQERLIRDILYAAKRYTLSSGDDLTTKPIGFDKLENSKIKISEQNSATFELKDLWYLSDGGYIKIEDMPSKIYAYLTEKGLSSIEKMGFDYVWLFKNFILSDDVRNIFCTDGYLKESMELAAKKLEEIGEVIYSSMNGFESTGNANPKPIEPIKIFYIQRFFKPLETKIAFDDKNKTIKEHMKDIVKSNDNKKGEALWEKLRLKSIREV